MAFKTNAATCKMNWNLLKRQTSGPAETSGVYADLDALIRLRFETQDFSLRPQQPVTSVLSGRYGSKLRGRGMDFAEIRRYQHGDDIRAMDWKVTARTRKPHIRVSAEEKDRAVLMVVDQRKCMFFGTKRQMKSVTAAECGAIGLWRALASGDRAGAVLFDDNEVVSYRPQRSEQTALQILGKLVQMNHALNLSAAPDPDSNVFNKALRRAKQIATHDVLVVIVSDMSAANAESERLITQLSEHNDVLALLTHDASRLDGIGASLRISDGEQQREVDFADRSTRQHLSEDYSREQDQLEQRLRRLAAPMLMINNGDDTVAQLRRLFGVPVPAASKK